MARFKRQTRETFFGTSMLDLLTCALGGVLLLVFLLQHANQQAADEMKIAKQQMAEELLNLKRGISVPLPLAVQIHWKGAGDIDLSVVKDGAERVWYKEPGRPWGELMRDETKGVTINSELILAPQLEPGRYDVFVWYYGGGDLSSYTVEGEIVLYPSEPSRTRRKQFTANVPVGTPREWIASASYRLAVSGSEVRIEWLD